MDNLQAAIQKRGAIAKMKLNDMESKALDSIKQFLDSRDEKVFALLDEDVLDIVLQYNAMFRYWTTVNPPSVVLIKTLEKFKKNIKCFNDETNNLLRVCFDTISKHKEKDIKEHKDCLRQMMVSVMNCLLEMEWKSITKYVNDALDKNKDSMIGGMVPNVWHKRTTNLTTKLTFMAKLISEDLMKSQIKELETTITLFKTIIDHPQIRSKIYTNTLRDGLDCVLIPELIIIINEYGNIGEYYNRLAPDFLSRLYDQSKMDVSHNTSIFTPSDSQLCTKYLDLLDEFAHLMPSPTSNT